MVVVLVALGGIALVGALSLFSGTFVWLLWPVAIPAAFPALVESGVLAAKLSWWASVCLSWIFGLLVKASQSVSAKTK